MQDQPTVSPPWRELAGIAAILIGSQLITLTVDWLIPGPGLANLRLRGLASLWMLGAVLYERHRQPSLFPSFRGGRGSSASILLVLLLAVPTLISGLTQQFISGTAEPWDISSLTVILVVPAAEELFFRGLLFGHLRQRLGLPAAIVITSLLFGFLHFPQGTAVMMTCASVILCLIVWRSGSILWAILVHLAWNSAATVFRLTDPTPRLSTAILALTVTVLLTGYAMRTRNEPQPDSPLPATESH